MARISFSITYSNKTNFSAFIAPSNIGELNNNLVTSKTKIISSLQWTVLLIGFVICSYALIQINVAMILIAVIVSAMIYLLLRQYVNDIKKTSDITEQSGLMRAEQAENHIEELQHYISEQDRISQALRESKEKFRHAAFHDSLTDLPNRNLFMETLKFALEKSQQNSKFKFAVLFLDINRFKTINDSLGHSVGNQLIIHIAKRLAGAVREKDLVAHFGGDEFAFLLNNITDVED